MVVEAGWAAEERAVEGCERGGQGMEAGKTYQRTDTG